MQKPGIPADEDARIDALRSYAILDTPLAPSFDRLTRLAAHLFDVPVALVSLIDSERQWIKSKVGIDVCETSRDVSLCAHAILNSTLFVVPDAAADQGLPTIPLWLASSISGSMPVHRCAAARVATWERSA